MRDVNREELGQLLDQEGVAPDAYTFAGGHPPETYVLSITPGGWTVYDSARGLETGRRDFDTEDAACKHLLSLLQCDETVSFRLVVGPLPPADADVEFQAWQERNSVIISQADLRVDNPTFTPTQKARRYWVRTTVLRSLVRQAPGGEETATEVERAYVPLIRSFLEGTASPSVFHDRFLTLWRHHRDFHAPTGPTIDELMTWVDGYDENPEVKWRVDPDELRGRASAALAALTPS